MDAEAEGERALHALVRITDPVHCLPVELATAVVIAMECTAV